MLKRVKALTSYIRDKRASLENNAIKVFAPLFTCYHFPDNVNKHSWVSQLEYYVKSEDKVLLETINITKLLDRFLKFSKLVSSTRNSVESAIRHQLYDREHSGIVGVIIAKYNWPEVEENKDTDSNEDINSNEDTNSNEDESDSHNDQDGIICISDNSDAWKLICRIDPSYCSVVKKQLTKKQCRIFGIEYPASRYAYYH